ncbi:MAG TPA: GNAT family protein [Nocardioides sp.]|uniref:GNAT family N-acetyltransferase n=1 Tax=Nocardioides sp. TaxID=35761 RepID=UPI002E3444DE|nr:GNAT family protein [Nocardioides sp.]HEX5089784.1 GNAT family protein [Nocardioides sp.]
MLPDGYSIRPFVPEDAEALVTTYRRNREHLGRWDPDRPASFYTLEGQQEEARERLAKVEQGLFASFVVVGPEGDLVGRANIQNIVRGPMQSGILGYFVDRDHLRLGLAKAAVRFLEEHALEIGLHRLEAGTMVENVPSQRVLESLGYEKYGMAPKLLFLNGAWRDHVLFQKLLHDRPLETG